MKKDIIKIKGLSIPVYSLNTIIIGSGAASLNCADHLFSYGQKDIAIVTTFLGGGTSNNAGSDKQTYYKLSISGREGDSPYKMARTLFNGGAMHGDIALIEATLSLQEFYHLVQIGVEFPHNRYGAYVGYKTDHDSSQRATSAGPLTSHQMVQCLLREVNQKGIPIFDRHELIQLLTAGQGNKKRVIGALAIDKKNIRTNNMGMVLFNSGNIVFGVGGPGGLYKTSVYPEDQIGSIGLALEIGAKAQNLNYSQFGLASTKFRWNLSGTYQQVIPRYFSTNKDGTDPQDFLNKHFPSMGKMTTAIFLKGYQWPFDSRKIKNYGSSLIDLIVYQETAIKGRRVFVDFTKNPQAGDDLEKFKFNELEKEAYDYLKKSNALLASPIARLKKMNPAAIVLYKSHNIDIIREPLEIAVCSQHNNGGLVGNIWWESNIKHLFPIGEVNGTHGIYRPGGSALNSGQVGGLRASQFIVKKYFFNPYPISKFALKIKNQVKKKITYCQNLVNNTGLISTVEKIRDEIQNRMSLYGAHIRKLSEVDKALKEAYQLQKRLNKEFKIKSRQELLNALKDTELCLTQIFYLEAIKAYLKKCPSKTLANKIEEISLKNGKIKCTWVSRHKIPDEEFWFETVWNECLQNLYLTK